MNEDKAPDSFNKPRITLIPLEWKKTANKYPSLNNRKQSPVIIEKLAHHDQWDISQECLLVLTFENQPMEIIALKE